MKTIHKTLKLRNRFRQHFIKPLSMILVLFNASNGYAAIEEIQALSFGTVLVIDNDEEQRFNISRRGFISYTDGIRIMNDWQPAVFRITEMNPFSLNNVLVEPVVPAMSPDEFSAETFTLEVNDFDTTVRADGDGVGSIEVGGTLVTSGSGSTNFSQTNFQTAIRITISR